MSIAINIKVNDGVVLAADSATTVIQPVGSPHQPTVTNIYNNANKVFNLLKGQPIGMISWGAGGIGSASISTLAKDLRQRFAEPGSDWTLDQSKYTVQWVAEKVREFMFEEQYQEAFRDSKPDAPPDLGFVVAGYSAGGSLVAEEYRITVQGGECLDPDRIRQSNEVGITWNGQGEAITRLLRGFGSMLPAVLQEEFGICGEELEAKMTSIAPQLQAAPVHPAMPIQDAINLAEFLVDTTIQFHKYLPGAPTVGGPIEIAAITRHEGFKWVQRKHYYPPELNPVEVHHGEADPATQHPSG